MSDKSINELQILLQNEFQKITGKYALAFKYKTTSDIEIYLNENVSFHAASTMKTPVMIEVFKQASEGLFSLTDKLPVYNSFTSIYDGTPFTLNQDSDGGEILYTKIGKEAYIIDLVYDMITVSSNLAANILVDLVRAENVNNTMHRLGASNMKIIRGVEDIKAYEAGMNNTTTARDLLVIFEKLANKEIISKKISEDILKILLDQTFNELIPTGLPHGVKVAHKTGLFSGVRHDSGIIYLPDKSYYILVILLERLQDVSKAIKIVNTISKKIYSFVTSIN